MFVNFPETCCAFLWTEHTLQYRTGVKKPGGGKGNDRRVPKVFLYICRNTCTKLKVGIMEEELFYFHCTVCGFIEAGVY